MTELEFLSKVDVCKGMDISELTKVLSCCEAVEYQPDQRVFTEGEAARDMCFVMKGEVAIRYNLPWKGQSEQTTISTIRHGGSFGWSAFVPPEKYTLSSYCTGSVCSLLRLDGQKLKEIFEQDPRLGYKFMSNLAVVIGKRFNRLREESTRRLGFDLMSS